MTRTDKPSGTRESTVYDGFISYSHAADGLLAPRLQAGLQRFAKPWWKRRAVRIFRDETSLSANPHLWSSITDALDDSAWFVLLMSPDAAESEWVNQELEYWKAHKDRSRILPVLTDGSFEWAGSDVSGSAVPDQLRGVFVEEPRWVDLRYAKDEDQLDLKNPRFADAVADIASALRGIPKDDLASEEVRQHRSTIRTAWAAGVVVAVLAVAAVVFGIQAGQQRQLAAANEQAALVNAEEAQRQARIAEQHAEEADEARQSAEEQAATTKSRFLAASASNVLQKDPELAMLLALEAVTTAPSRVVEFEAELVLVHAVRENRLIGRFDTPSVNYAVISPDGNTIYRASEPDGMLVAIEISSGNVAEPFFVADEGDRISWITLASDGNLLAVAVEGANSRVLLFDPTVPKELHSFTASGCPTFREPPDISSDGRYLTMTDGTVNCGDPDHPNADWAVVYDVETAEPVGPRIDKDGVEEAVTFSSGSALVLIRSSPATGRSNQLRSFPQSYYELRTFPEFELVLTIESAAWAVPSESGNSIAYNTSPVRNDVKILDVETGQQTVAETLKEGFVLFHVDHSSGPPYSFSPDESLVAVTTTGHDNQLRTVVYNVSNGSIAFALPILELRNILLAEVVMSWASDSSRLLTTVEDRVLLWDATPARERALETEGDLVESALQILTRGFTDAECATYDLAPCPTLKTLQARD